MGPFSEHLVGLSFPPASSRSSSTRTAKEARGTEQTKKGAFCLSLFLGPVEIVGLSTAPCLPRDFISWNRAPPSQTLVPIAWDRVENLHHAQDRFEIGGLAFVCPPQDEGMMGWWSLDQTGRLVEVSRLQTQQAGAWVFISSLQGKVVSIATPLCQPSIRPNLVPTGINPAREVFSPTPFTVPLTVILPSLFAHPEPAPAETAMQHTHESGHTVGPLLHHSPNPSSASRLPVPSPNPGSFPKQYSVPSVMSNKPDPIDEINAPNCGGVSSAVAVAVALGGQHSS